METSIKNIIIKSIWKLIKIFKFKMDEHEEVGERLNIKKVKM